LRHGTFLDKGQFEKVFLESSGVVSEAIGVLAFLHVVAFISDPRGFLSFTPTIEC
jgi:hypothetical protein